MNDTEKYRHYPNLYRVAQELARCEHPYKVANAMIALLSTDPEIIRTDKKEAAMNPTDELRRKIIDQVAALDSERELDLLLRLVCGLVGEETKKEDRQHG